MNQSMGRSHFFHGFPHFSRLSWTNLGLSHFFPWISHVFPWIVPGFFPRKRPGVEKNTSPLRRRQARLLEVSCYARLVHDWVYMAAAHPRCIIMYIYIYTDTLYVYLYDISIYLYDISIYLDDISNMIYDI